MNYKSELSNIELSFSEVDEFLNYLAPYKDHWKFPEINPSPNDLGWIFRGQGDAEWSLNPSLYREPGIGLSKLLPGQLYGTEAKIDRPDHLIHNSIVRGFSRKELELVRRFINISDDVGINIGHLRSSQLQSIFNAAERKLNSSPRNDVVYVHLKQMDVYNNFPPEELYDAFSLAQHNSIPTRFLDWTYSPFVAAFFAANKVASAGIKSEKIAIWTLNYSNPFIRDLNSVLKVVESSNSTNHYLKSQKGVFTLVPAANARFSSSGKWVSHDEVIITSLTSVKSIKDVFRKITLPSKKSAELLLALSKMGINYISIFPSLENIYKYLLDEITIKKEG